MFVASSMQAQNGKRCRCAPSRRVTHVGGFYRSGVIAPQREDQVFERYRRLLVERHGEEKAPRAPVDESFNNLVWPNLSVNALRRAAHRAPLAADRTVVEVQCLRLDGAPSQMHDLTLQFVNLAASPASLIASDDLKIFERCQRGLERLGRGLIDLRRGAADSDADGSTTSPGTSEVAIRTQLLPGAA